MNLDNLKIQIPYKWRIGQTFSSSKSPTGFYGRCLAYIDARDVMDLLDFVVGQENWSDEYYEVKGQVVCRLGIKNPEWVYKSDTGSAGEFEAEKSVMSDSFKRAAVKWGVGRFLYDMDTEIVEVEKKGNRTHPVIAGKRIYDLSEHINSKDKHQKRLKKAREQLKAIKGKNV